MTLATAAFGRPSLPKFVALAFTGTLLIAAAAKVAVPFWPAPLTLQTLAVMIVGATLGPRLGGATLMLYLAQGAAGLPVFTPTTAPGMAAFAGPTAGFLVGFVPMAVIAGLAAERLRGVVALSVALIGASALLYVFGAAWPLGIAAALGIDAGWATLPAAKVLEFFVLPFLLGDALKSVIAALVVAGGWRLAARG